MSHRGIQGGTLRIRGILFLGFVLLTQGCSFHIKPFIRLEPDLAAGPFYSEAPRDEPMPIQNSDEACLDRLENLVNRQLLVEASALCDQYLVCHPDTPLRELIRLKRLKIQFMQNVLHGGISGGGLSWLSTDNDWLGRAYVRHEGYSQTLDAFLVQEGFQTPEESESETTRTYFDEERFGVIMGSNIFSYRYSSFPNEEEFDYLLALIDETRRVLDQMQIRPAQETFMEERDQFVAFLRDFEKEIILLRFWDIVWVGEWDRAVEYASSPPRLQKPLQEEFSLLKEQVNQRKILPRRKKVVGGILSAIVPGGGAAYGDRWPRAVGWFLAETALAGAATYFFHESGWEDDSELILGSSFALIGLCVHGCNIVDGVEAVEDYNEVQRRSEIRGFFETNFPASRRLDRKNPYPRE